MSAVALLVAGAALALAGAGSAAKQQQNADVAADVRMLAAEMERLHPDLFHAVSREELNGAVEGHRRPDARVSR